VAIRSSSMPPVVVTHRHDRGHAAPAAGPPGSLTDQQIINGKVPADSSSMSISAGPSRCVHAISLRCRVTLYGNRVTLYGNQAPLTAAQWTCRWGGRRLARASGPATLRAALAGRARSRPLAVAAHLIKSLDDSRCGVRVGVLAFGRVMARSRDDFHLVGRDGELALLAG
jgi:hypothetical protein